jgi:CDP-glycerol glycerophosphotransferase (TagB/SpsB family)
MKPTPSEPTGPARRPTPALELLGIEWQRIQVVLDVRPTDGATVDPTAVRLVHGGRRALAMPPTAARREGERTLLRFNVMQGPGQAPLAPGRWTVVAGGGEHGGRTGVPVEVGDGVDLARAACRFRIEAQELAFTPRVDRAARSFAIEVGRRRVGRLPGEPGPAARFREAARRGIFRTVVRAIRVAARRNGRRILFTSESRTELSGNLKLVHDRIVERGLDREHEIRTLLRPSVHERRSVADRLRLPWILARADTIVIDDFQPVIYALEASDSRIVQLWHAVGAFKTVGYSRVGKVGGPNPYGRAHKNYALVTVGARRDIPVYAEAFGIPEDRVVATGIPRTDRFFDPSYAGQARELALDAFPEARGRTTILFAPTFRGNGAKTATYDLDRIDVAALHALCVERDAVCIVRLHPFVREPLVIPEAYRDRVLDGQRSPIDVNDLLFAVDLLVTDYSSIVYEFSTLGRPMLFYAWDLEEYAASRDTYEPYETFVPGRIVRTFAELLDAIRHDDCEIEKVAPFAERHFEHRDGRSTDRVVDLILGR